MIYGGENEHREYLSDVIVFDVKPATWTSAQITGGFPKGRARHAAVVHDEKLFIVGGVTGLESYTLDDVCYLDLKTWTWSRSWRFTPRFDHSAWVWGGRLWVFGGLGPDMEHTGDLWSLDLRGSPVFKSSPEFGTGDLTPVPRSTQSSRLGHNAPAAQPAITSGPTTTTYAANSRSTAARAVHNPRPVAPGALGSISFHAGANVPSPYVGTHFYCYSSGALLDFVTPSGSSRTSECSLSVFELSTLQWQKVADGNELFDPAYRWKYCAINDEGTKAWLLGCPSDFQEGPGGSSEVYLSDAMCLDLTKYGLFGGDLAPESKLGVGKIPASDACPSSSLSGPAVDLANVFDQPLESGTGDFQITALQDDYVGEDDEFVSLVSQAVPESTNSNHSQPINVHKLILLARWPHFTRAYGAQMAEFHSKKMHIPEPYSVVRAFLYYLYTDSIEKHDQYCPTLYEVAGMMVMANVYDMPRLRALCVHRLSREMDVESAAIIWERAGVANDEWLKRRAASFCMTHWGRIVRTSGFRRLNQQSMLDLCEVIDIEGRVVGGDELEAVGGLGGGRFGYGGIGSGTTVTRRRQSTNANMSDGLEGTEADDDDSMEVN